MVFMTFKILVILPPQAPMVHKPQGVWGQTPIGQSVGRSLNTQGMTCAIAYLHYVQPFTFNYKMIYNDLQ